MGNYSRQLSLYADGVKVCDGCRIRVIGKSTMSLMPDTWIISVYNISSDDAVRINGAQSFAASGQFESVICAGKPFDISTYWQDNNEVFQVTLLDGQDIWNSVVNVTIVSEMSLKQALQSVLNKCSPSFRTAVTSLSDAKTAKGISCYGRACDYIQMLAGNDYLMYVFQNTLYIASKDDSSNIIITDSDLIDAPQKIHGGYILPMTARGLFVGASVNVDTDMVNGTYRLIGYMVSADNAQGDWYCRAIISNERVVDT